MQQIQVEVIGFETLEGALAGRDDPAACRMVRIDLAHQESSRSAAGDRRGDEPLGCAITIHFGGIDHEYSELESKA